MDMAWHCRFCIGIAEFGYYFFLRGLSFSSEIASDGAPCSRQHGRFKFHCHSETECHCNNENTSPAEVRFVGSSRAGRTATSGYPAKKGVPRSFLMTIIRGRL